jgi:hypothetical protein
MESEGEPRGGNHCAEFHQRILLKKPMIDMVQVNANTLYKLHPPFSPSTVAQSTLPTLAPPASAYPSPRTRLWRTRCSCHFLYLTLPPLPPRWRA